MSVPAATLSTAMNLEQLLEGFADAPPIPLSDISSDSRRLTEGGLFVACQGATSHGLDFLDQAAAAHVAAVIWDPATTDAPDSDLPLIPVAGLSRHIGAIANRFFDAPSEHLRVSGVTGTNGKTTVAWLLRQCLDAAGRRCAYVGTLGAGLDAMAGTGGMTTPDCIEMHRLLADFREAGASDAAIEVSSHALAQERVAGLRFHTALFTNLSRDHIDYHGGMREYGETKARLFLEFDVAHRIVCADSEFGGALAEAVGPECVVVTAESDCAGAGRFVAARSVSAEADGSRIEFASSWGAGEIALPLPGRFNIANALQVLAAMLCRDVALEDACALLRNVSAPPGRMQRVPALANTPAPAVFVDYAHTPASLEAALLALRQHCAGRLWCVFGCGGDRDRGKRRMMGEIAGRLADVALVTNDNPRSEPPARIFADILEGMSGDTLVIEDRGAAIGHAIAGAAPDDAVLLAGKGHEDYQVIGSQVLHFSDYDVATACLESRVGDGV